MFALVLDRDGQAFHGALTCNSTGQSPLSSHPCQFRARSKQPQFPKRARACNNAAARGRWNITSSFPFLGSVKFPTATTQAGSAHGFSRARDRNSENGTESIFNAAARRLHAKRTGRWLVMLPERSWSLTIPPPGKDDVLPAALQSPLYDPRSGITNPGPHSPLASPLQFQGARSSGCCPPSCSSLGSKPRPRYLLLPRFSPLGSSSTGLRSLGCDGRLPHASLSASASSPCPVSRRIETNTGKARCPRLSRSITSCRACSLRVPRLCGGKKHGMRLRGAPPAFPPCTPH